MMKIAIQLYTLRGIINHNFSEMIEQVKQMGYDGVEFAGFYDLKQDQMKALLDHVDLKAYASHTSLAQLESSFDEVMIYNQTIGNRNIVIPHTEMKDQASYQDILPKLQDITHKLIAQGMHVYYHNHAHEFNQIDGIYILDQLLEDIPQLRLELDVYWAVHAGIDVNKYIMKHKERIDFIHAKDMEINGDDHSFTSVGDGVIDYKSIYQLPTHIKLWIVENDRPKDDCLENIRRSITYIKNMIKGDES